MDQKPENNATFYTLLFAGLMVGGAIAGMTLAAHVVPDSHAVSVIGLMMLPLGAIIGLSIGLGTMPPTALLNLMSVFEGRHTIAEMMAQKGSGGSMSLAIGTVVGTVVVSIMMAFVVDVLVKPELPFADLATWFGGAGLAFGALSGATLFFMTE